MLCGCRLFLVRCLQRIPHSCFGQPRWAGFCHTAWESCRSRERNWLRWVGWACRNDNNDRRPGIWRCGCCLKFQSPARSALLMAKLEKFYSRLFGCGVRQLCSCMNIFVHAFASRAAITNFQLQPVVVDELHVLQSKCVFIQACLSIEMYLSTKNLNL